MRALSCPFRLIVCVSVLCAFLAARPQPWVEVRSPHFVVVSDGGEQRARQVALRFEEMRAVFAENILKERLKSKPLEVVAFRDAREMRDYVPIFRGKPVELSGFFQPGYDVDFVALDLSAENHWEAVFHEYGHSILSENYQNTPIWFAEGFADYHSTIQVMGKEVVLGSVPERYGDLLTTARLMPLLDLFAVTRESPVYNESGDRRSVFYVQCWLTFHYLLDMGKLQQTSELFKLTEDKHVAIQPAIQQAFGMSAQQLEEDFYKYFRHNRITIRRAPAPARLDEKSFAVRQLAAPDAAAVLADVHLHSKDHAAAALSEFKAILQTDPDNVAAHRGLAYAYFLQRDHEAAAAEFRRAAALHSDDPKVHYYAAILGHEGFDRRSTEDADYMTKELQSAASLDPQNAEYQNLLGGVNQAQHNYEEALDHFRQAHFLDPDNERYRLNMVEMLLMLKRFDEAERMATLLRDSNDPAVAMRAAGALEFISRMKQRETGSESEASSSGASDDQNQPVRVSLTDRQASSADRAREKPVPMPRVKAEPLSFLRGTIVRVSCNDDGSATVRFAYRATTYRLSTPDRTKLQLSGAKEFSCGWKSRKAGVSFHPHGDGEGELISLDLD